MKRIIVVDLDGTLIKSDSLLESYLLYIKKFPIKFFLPIFWLFKGKLNLKNKIANWVVPNAKFFPYNYELINWLKKQKEEGAVLILATASHQKIAKSVFDHIDIFDDFIASKNINLSSSEKRCKLVERYGDFKFEYVGNSKDDISVWKSASIVHTVNITKSVWKSLNKFDHVKGMNFSNKESNILGIFKALRVHQYVKNILIFVPLFTSIDTFKMETFFNGILAFIAFCLCASSVYIVNDLLDIPDDRKHPSKYTRSIASGDLSIINAMIWSVALLISTFLISFLLPIEFTISIFIYCILTLTYSFFLKKLIIIDVVSLALLYSLRVVAGATAMSLTVTFWLIAFCLFMFFSLAMIKRCTELKAIQTIGRDDKTSGRGYYTTDFELLSALGGASGLLAVMVLALYINDPMIVPTFRAPEWMWLNLPLIMFWICRIWLLSHRGLVHSDPIVFAIKDKTSFLIAILFILFFTMAKL